jgi:hypothetical protein
MKEEDCWNIPKGWKVPKGSRLEFLRVAEGFVPYIVPPNATKELEDAIKMDAFNAILARQERSNKSLADYAESFDLMLSIQEGVPASKLRETWKGKLLSKRDARKRVQRVKDRSNIPLFNDRRVDFIRLNWQVPTLVTNPRYKHLPGFKFLRTRKALEVMRGEKWLNMGPQHDAKWYKRERQRLGLRPAPGRKGRPKIGGPQPP